MELEQHVPRLVVPGRCGDGRGVQAGPGERPLWDFPSGLYQREVAAWRLSEFLGWTLVPETVLRPDAPLGAGSMQRFVDADFSEHYFTLQDDPAHHQQLFDIAVFDLLLNNADRKSGHCLLASDGHIWAIDNGLSFHVEPKLRTVIWDFAGEPIGDQDLEDLRRLARRGLPPALTAQLHEDEAAAVEVRIGRLVRSGRLPRPGSQRPYPWPLV